METILTGIRVNGELTLGNLLGALLPMSRLAEQYKATHKINVFVPDLHTIIADVDGDLRANTLKSLRYYAAAGLDLAHENIAIYRQSYVPAHSELCWILDCVATMGEMNRMTQFKEKSGAGDGTNVGIFNYPVLMAADILLYSAKYVPVGEDQFQHLELTRNLAERFNNRFGEVFTLPAATAEQAAFMQGLAAEGKKADGIRIRDLQNPEKKMSKSSRAENSKIMMSDTPEAAAAKIMSATTDSVNKVQFDMFNQPGISNLLQILALVTGDTLESVASRFAGETRYGEFKRKVADAVEQFMYEFQAKAAEVSDEDILAALVRGEKLANEIANAKLLEVQKAVALR
ncbi:MAG: tryptophan--tRNA ligase [Candidatus Nomurabacteria bacterium]|jgi:tryptophanyl-tRNA synthetase|nr:tryptophan--tRNA ligase [Candidatus Nomurabacteria bacterium]